MSFYSVISGGSVLTVVKYLDIEYVSCLIAVMDEGHTYAIKNQ